MPIDSNKCAWDKCIITTLRMFVIVISCVLRGVTLVVRCVDHMYEWYKLLWSAM